MLVSLYCPLPPAQVTVERDSPSGRRTGRRRRQLTPPSVERWAEDTEQLHAHRCEGELSRSVATLNCSRRENKLKLHLGLLRKSYGFKRHFKICFGQLGSCKINLIKTQFILKLTSGQPGPQKQRSLTALLAENYERRQIWFSFHQFARASQQMFYNDTQLVRRVYFLLC